MLTRKKRQEEIKRQKHNRMLEAHSKVSRLRNPYSTYRITQSYYLNDEILGDPSHRVDMFSAIFDWNSIDYATANQHSITFELSPLNNASAPPPEYLVERFLSFGNKFYFQLAQNIKELLELNKTMFPPPLPEASPDNYWNSLCLLGEPSGPHPVPAMTKIIVSKKLCRSLGFDEETLMMLAVKFGRLPFLIEKQAAAVAETCLGYLKLVVLYNQIVQSQNLEAFQQLIRSARGPIECNIVTTQKKIKTNSLESVFLSPRCMLFNFDNITFDEDFQIKHRRPKTAIESEELETLHKLRLAEIPQSELTDFKNRICNFRDK